MKPWFIYYSTGCSHAPHHVAREWEREIPGQSWTRGGTRCARRPSNDRRSLGSSRPTRCSPRPDALPAWDSLSDSEKRLYARQMEVYAGYQENADWNVGRLLDAVEEMDERDNTLVFYIFGDNGASMEGTITAR